MPSPWSFTFEPVFVVAADSGFVSFFAADNDSVEAVWLDGRATAGGGHESHGAPRGAMQLGNARIGPDGGVAASTLIDDRICDCCQTSAAMTSRGPVVVYRDRSPDEIRDIGILRRVDGKWTQPAIVHADKLTRPLLLVPVRYYRARPSHWKQWHHQAPPRWDREWGREWADKREWRRPVRDDDGRQGWKRERHRRR